MNHRDLAMGIEQNELKHNIKIDFQKAIPVHIALCKAVYVFSDTPRGVYSQAVKAVYKPNFL